MKKRLLTLALAAMLLVCLLPAGAYADAAKTSAQSDSTEDTIAIEDAIINAPGETLYNDGDTVFNNYGTVFNNGGIVFNNGGTVYNNAGTVYNNGGTVYNNAGTVYNNGGSVEDNSVAAAAVTGADKLTDKDTAAADSAKPDSTKDAKSSASATSGKTEYTVTLAGDYSAFVDIDGLTENDDGTYTATSTSVATITPKSGITVTDATATTGACSVSDAGIFSLERVDADGTLTLKFKLDVPVITPGSATYCDDTDITITAADGADIYYTLDGSTPTEKSEKYTKPFEIDSSTVIKAIAVMDGARTSDTAEESYVFPVIRDIDFGHETVGYTQPDPVAFVVKNTGLGKLTVESVTLDGADKSRFILNTEEGGTVPTGQINSKTWTVVPKKGLSAGEYEAEAVFTFDSGEQMRVEISFTVDKPSSSGKA